MNNSINTSSINAVMEIQREFPAIAYPAKNDSLIKQLFKVVQCFADYTKKQLAEDNEAEVVHCYRTAHHILQHGGNIAKVAIENVFISDVSKTLESSFSVSRNARPLFLQYFKKEYARHISASLA